MLVMHSSAGGCVAALRRCRLMPSLLLSLLVFVFLCGSDSGGKWASLAAHAATPHQSSSQPWATQSGNGSRHVYASLAEVNEMTFGAPYTFSEVSDNRGDVAVTAPTDEEVAVAVQRARDQGRRAGYSTQARYSASTGGIPVGAASAEATKSMCAADFTCPRSSVAWASGSFTVAELLTPHSLALPVGLTLKLSLCCQYRFNGTLLRSAELYDIFLEELLRASPFQVLSAAEKREMFPQALIFAVDTWDRRRVYNSSYLLTDVDVAEHNDGDGDVLVLTTGVLAPATLLKVIASSPALSGVGRRRLGTIHEAHTKTNTTDLTTAPQAEARAAADNGEMDGSESVVETWLAASADMQLHITSRVLKCKCPHVLTVMPLLHVQRDVLPRIGIVGLGSHCGVPTSTNNTRSADAPPPRGSPLRATQHIRRVRGADGAATFAVFFEVTPPVPLMSLVTWTVRRVVEEEFNRTAPLGELSRADEHHTGSSNGSGRADPSTSPTYGPPVLRHSRLLLVPHHSAGGTSDDADASAVPTSTDSSLLGSSAASPFFVVEPNVRYEVSVRVSRLLLAPALLARVTGAPEGEPIDAEPGVGASALGGDFWSSPSAALAERMARGRFVLRLPLNRSWALPTVHPAPHFGFRRAMRLTNSTLSRAVVMAALDPYYPLHSSFPASPPRESTSRAISETDGAGRIGGGSSGTALRRRRPLAYYGYWENAPLRDQPLPQESTRVLANPYTEPSALGRNADDTDGDGEPGGVLVPLFLGRNLVAYLVRDVDDVCDPVVLEGREVWAVQSHITTAGPMTACGEKQDVSALVLRQLLLRMRVEPRLEVTVPNTTWLADPRGLAEAAREGCYRCEARSSAAATSTTAKTDHAASLPVCVAAPDAQRDVSEVYASLSMSDRGVYEVVWVARVAVREERLLSKANLDPLYTTVIPVTPSTEASSAALFIVEVRSRPLLVVRRLASYPHVIAVELPMHARRWEVSAPRSLAELTLPLTASSTPLSALQRRQWARRGGVSSGTDVLSDNVPTGYWRSRFPLRVLSVDEQLKVELDTGDVPNVQRTLPNGTLEFVAQDTGEALSLSVVIDGAVRTFTYTSQCPDTHVEYQIYVVALPPPPIVPAFAPIYTEEECVLLVAPREVRKDEVAEWRVPPCASARQPPYLVKRSISVEEQEEMQIITTAVDGGTPLALTTAGAAPRPVTALMACGVEAYHYCDIVWSVHNLVETVQKTYSLRRCQRPPDVVFHEDDRQQRVSYPEANVFRLPSLTEAAYTRANVSALAPVGAASASIDAVEVISRHRRHRRVIPIAGFSADIGYSFDYGGQQSYFEMELHPVKNAVAHQLWSAQHDYAADKDGPMVLRRRVRMDVRRQQKEAPKGGDGTDEWGADAAGSSSDSIEDKDLFWTEYRTSKAPSIGKTPPPPPAEHAAELAKQRERHRRRHQRDEQLDTKLEETYALLHETEARRLDVAEVGDASLFPMDYIVRGSPAVLSAEAQADKSEFVRRGMCVEHPGYFAVLAVNPRGAVRGDERYGTVLPPPPAPAVAVIPFCAPQYTFARYPELFSVYGYDFTWTCPDAVAIKAEKHHPTYSVLYHAPERYSRAAAAPSVNASEALCQLTVTNHITRTEQREWFLMRRVHPSPLPATALIVLSHNAASSLQVVTPPSSGPRTPRSRGTHRSERAPQPQPPFSSATRFASTQNAAAPPTIVPIEKLYTAPADMYPFARARRIVGKSAVLHVDAPSDPAVARWAVTSVVTTASTTVGSQVLMDDVKFQSLPRHPAAVARGRGGSTVLIKGLRTPGLYTITHSLPDPENPNVCPPVTLTEMLDVFHAQVVERELFVCGDTAALRAVPIPREIAHEFVGQWEVVSLATGATTVWTAGVNFTGIRFDRGMRAETRVHGLPFGIVTIRWAVYRLLPLSSDIYFPPSSSNAAGENIDDDDTRGRAASSVSATQHRILVDYDTVDVFVLTENLPSHRLVTLADRATILTTSSTQNWRLEVAMASSGASATVDVATQARMSLRSIRNHSDGEAAAFLFSSDDTATDGAARAMLRTYFGLHPRPGSGVLLLEHLPVGTVHLHYDLVPSRSIFGRMEGHTCTLKGRYEVERVSAYLTATTSMDHECDGYTGQGRITLCLHTEGVPKASLRARGQSQSSRADVHFWQSQVRLIDPAALEDTVKRGAREVERLSGGRCATPWWVSPTTQWFSPSYTSTSAVSLPGRCISFTVKAGRHLSAREVLQPLFVAVPRSSSPSTPTLVASSGMYASRVGDSDAAGAATHSAAVCPFHGDFISIRIIDGAPSTGAGVLDGTDGAGGRDQRRGQDGTAAATSRLGLSQLFQLGLPHTFGDAAVFAFTLLGREGSAERDDSSGGGGAWGIRYLPVLQQATLQRANATMRPMMALRGVQDDVTYEVNISGRTTTFGGPENVAAEETAEATVLLRLDLSRPRQFGGFIISPSVAAELNSTQRTAMAPMPSERVHAASQGDVDAASSSSGPAPSAALPYHSLLYKCVEGTVRGADILQYWTETNRPDGRVDRTVQEWLDYAFAVRDATVLCDVLFGSLDHLIIKAHGDGPSTASSTTPSSSGSRYGQRQRRGQQRVALRQGESLARQQQQQYISLAEMEKQVERIRRQFKVTSDGIDVTGLPADLQRALSRRRVTATQLRAIEAARKARRDAEEAALAEETRQKQLQQREQQGTPSHMSPTERLANALRAYQGVVQGGEVAVLRIRLPLKESFTVPYDVFLRAALHKDVLCGTTIDPPPSFTDPSVQPTVANPHSLVPLGRVEVRDTAPVLSAYPPVVKQCEVEGGMPVLTFELTGANFARNVFTADAVTLEEIPNPALAKREHGASHDLEVGLTACIEQMRRGLRAAVEATSRKRLYLQLGACPAFKMLTPEEYNEHQDSEALLQRMQLPRYLRVTVRNAIHPDSFLAPSARTAGSGASNASGWRWMPARELPKSVPVTSTDASFVVEVRPTLARLHLRSSADMPLPDAATEDRAARGRRRRESGSSWGGGDSTAVLSPTDPSTSAATKLAQPPGPSFEPARPRQLLLCEANLRRYGFQLGVELIGDTWTPTVGEDSYSTGPFSRSAAYDGTIVYDDQQQRAALPRRRAPANVALINSFQVVEHHSLDSSHHLYMKGGGMYRSHFIDYLFSELLSDPAILQGHRFVYRYNDTFIGVSIPPLPTNAAAATSHRGHRDSAWRDGQPFEAGAVEYPDVHTAPGQQGSVRQRSTGGSGGGATSAVIGSSRVTAAALSSVFPAVRKFARVEEILFTVPGIATECRGCLLADTTFCVAGDLTGVWIASLSSGTASAAAGATGAASTTASAAGTANSGAPANGAVRAHASRTGEKYTSPLVLRWDSVTHVPRRWQLDWICPATAHRALERLALQLGGRSDGAALSIVMDVVLYRLRGVDGEALTAAQRPMVLLSSTPAKVADVLHENHAYTRRAGTGTGQITLAAPLVLWVSQTAVDAAYTQVADDTLRRRRHAHTTLEYHRDDRHAGGLLVVNASIFLKVCTSDLADGAAPCMIVSITDALLTVETPKVAMRTASWARRLLGRGSGGTSVGSPTGDASCDASSSPVSLTVLLHHIFMAFLVHELLPLLGIVVVAQSPPGTASALSASLLEDQRRARVAFAIIAFFFFFFVYAYGPPTAWLVLCLAVWSLSLYCSGRAELVFLFVASVVYTHYLM